MSKSNPAKAVAAMLPLPIECGGDVVVYPLSLAHYAILESIDSPMLWAEDRASTDNCTMLKMLSSLYVVTHAANEVFGALPSLDDIAIEWSSNLLPSQFEQIKSAVNQQIQLMLNVVPNPADGKKKVGLMGGLYRWLMVLAHRMGGAGKRLFTRHQLA